MCMLYRLSILFSEFLIMTHLKLLIFVLLFIQIYGRENKLLLTVYYESKCPDSKSFILRQLQPTYNLLHPHIRLKMIPFGKAQSINYGDEGFECQHGPSECMGNIVQDCALHHMRGRSDAKLLAYVACEMKTEAAAKGDFYCVERAGLPTSTIGHCAMSGQGVALQMESEYYTSLPRPKFIPTITINGVFDQQIQNDAQNDLLGTLCSILTEAPPCARYHNKIAMNHLLYSNGPMYYLNAGYLTK